MHLSYDGSVRRNDIYIFKTQFFIHNSAEWICAVFSVEVGSWRKSGWQTTRIANTLDYISNCKKYRRTPWRMHQFLSKMCRFTHVMSTQKQQTVCGTNVITLGTVIMSKNCKNGSGYFFRRCKRKKYSFLINDTSNAVRFILAPFPSHDQTVDDL